MHRILFEIGDFPIRSFGVGVVVSIILAAGIACYMTKGTKYRGHVIDMLLLVLICSFVGARIWHVFFFQWDYYGDHLGQIFAIWNGGIAIQGGLVGGFAGGAYYTWRHKLNFWEYADYLAPAIIFGQGVGRMACFLTAGDFGEPTDAGFGIIYPPGTVAYATYGDQPLWPARLWEGQWDFIVFGLLLMMMNRKWPKGFIFLSYNILYSLGRFFLGFLRGDSAGLWLDWTAGQWTSVAVVIAALIVMPFILRKSRVPIEQNT
ncbi:MAG TPA: prolipoprotein diacylglyceryl transferase [Bacillales bacterium]